jgi:hypothetical protein
MEEEFQGLSSRLLSPVTAESLQIPGPAHRMLARLLRTALLQSRTAPRRPLMLGRTLGWTVLPRRLTPDRTRGNQILAIRLRSTLASATTVGVEVWPTSPVPTMQGQRFALQRISVQPTMAGVEARPISPVPTTSDPTLRVLTSTSA